MTCVLRYQVKAFKRMATITFSKANSEAICNHIWLRHLQLDVAHGYLKDHKKDGGKYIISTVVVALAIGVSALSTIWSPHLDFLDKLVCQM